MGRMNFKRILEYTKSAPNISHSEMDSAFYEKSALARRKSSLVGRVLTRFSMTSMQIIPDIGYMNNCSLLTKEHAAAFIQLVPVVMCVMNSSGNILHYNSEYLRHIDVTNYAQNNSYIFNMLDVICVEDADRFYSSMSSLVATSSEGSSCCGIYQTKLKNLNEKFHGSFHWTLSKLANDNALLVTGRLLYDDSEYKSAHSKYKKFTQPAASPCTTSGTPMGGSSDDGSGTDWSSKNSSDDASQIRSSWIKFMGKARIIQLREEERSKSQALTETLETKRIFVRHASHEIRTPLNVVLSGLEYMNKFKDSMNEEMKEVIRDIKSACSIAIEVLNDLLTYEKLDSNILTLDKSTCDVVELVSRVFGMFMIQAKNSGIQLVLDNKLPTDTCVIEADATKISQVFRNLFSNAIKFTPAGGTVTAKLFVDDVTKLFRIEVQDTGAGMSKDNRKKLFNEVIQFNARELQNGQGSGLGLYLSRRIIDMHGGMIGVDCEWEGAGSIFYIELPVSNKKEVNLKVRKLSFVYLNQDGSVPNAGLIQESELRLLVVDDALLVRKFHRRMLSHSCNDFTEACDGLEAIACVKESMKNRRPFDGILMDYSMPVMDGPSAVQQIRQLGYQGKIFGITGHGYEADINEFVDHGANEVLIKPMSLDRYAHIVSSIEEDLRLKNEHITLMKTK